MINHFPELYRTAWLEVVRHKLALTTVQDDDITLITDLLSTMEAQGADFTLTFRGLANLVAPGRRRHPTRPHPVQAPGGLRRLDNPMDAALRPRPHARSRARNPDARHQPPVHPPQPPRRQSPDGG